MIQGSTPLHTITFPSNPADYAQIKLMYRQNGAIVVTKYKSDFTFGENNTGSVRLSQKETLSFIENCDAEVQVEVLTVSGESIPSEVLSIPVGELLDKEVIAGEITD